MEQMQRQALITDLIAATAADRVITDPAELFVYESDGFTIAHARPAAVVFVTSTEEVQKVIRILIKHEAQIVPRGTGTGLAGGCVAFDNGVVVSTVKMNKIFTIDLENRVAHVQAGVRNTALSDAVAQLPLEVEAARSAQEPPATSSPSFDPVDAAAGAALSTPKKYTPVTNPYHFAPDPSSQRASTVGGNASTNAGGIHTLKDFVTSNHILGLEMVLPDGQILVTGGRSGCYESGHFDLPGLICGHEGTFGIVCRLWVRLVPKALHFRTVLGMFSAPAGACEAVSAVIAGGMLPAAMEMMDGRMIRVIGDAYHFGFPATAQALVLTEIDGIPD